MLTILLQFVVLPLWTLLLLVLLCCIVQTAFDNMAKSYYAAKLAYEMKLREMMFGDMQPPSGKVDYQYKPVDEYPPRPGQYTV